MGRSEGPGRYINKPAYTYFPIRYQQLVHPKVTVVDVVSSSCSCFREIFVSVYPLLIHTHTHTLSFFLSFFRKCSHGWTPFLLLLLPQKPAKGGAGVTDDDAPASVAERRRRRRAG